jgi:hypothetical protein
MIASTIIGHRIYFLVQELVIILLELMLLVINDPVALKITWPNRKILTHRIFRYNKIRCLFGLLIRMNYPVSVLYEISPSQQAVDLQFFWGIDVNPWQMLLPLSSPEYCSDLFVFLHLQLY